MVSVQIAAILTTPFDVVKTRLQVSSQEGNIRFFKTVVDEAE